MNDRDPRLLGDPDAGTPALLRDAIASARDDVPDAAHLARLAARLPGGVPPSGGPSGGASISHVREVVRAGAPAVAATPSVLSGAIIGAALGAIVSGVAFVWDANRAPDHVATSSETTPIAEAPRAPIDARAATPAAPATSIAVASPAPSTHDPALAPKPSSAPSAGAPSADAPSASTREPSATLDVGSAMPASDAETEADLLQRARAAIGRDPAYALSLTAEHASRFRSGVLAQEREVLAIRALFKLGRAGEGRARAQRFIEAWPGSAHRRSLEVLLAQ